MHLRHAWFMRGRLHPRRRPDTRECAACGRVQTRFPTTTSESVWRTYVEGDDTPDRIDAVAFNPVVWTVVVLAAVAVVAAHFA